MKKLNLISAAGHILILILWLSASVPAYADQVIVVAPMDYDFGDVEVGSSSTAIITISNFNGHALVVYSLSLLGSADFSITMAPDLPAVVVPQMTTEVEVTFAPSSDGYVTAVLEIASNDAANPLVSVSLGGMGVPQEQPPLSVADIMAFFDASVADGTLFGNGSGKSANGREGALRNMIEAAGDLIDDGDIAEACQQLVDACNRTDGLERPPEFVAGPAASSLAQMIMDLMASLDCE